MLFHNELQMNKSYLAKLFLTQVKKLLIIFIIIGTILNRANTAQIPEIVLDEKEFLVFNVNITNTDPVIPTSALVDNGNVLYRTTIDMTLSPSAVTNIQWSSNRAQDNFIQQDIATDSNGKASATSETRLNGNATITMNIYGKNNNTNINFQEADYESTFYTTCYIVALEDDYSGEVIVNPNGLQGEYIRAFLVDVRMQGSGRDRNGNLIQIDWSQGDPMGSFETTYFTIVSQIITASGVALTENVSIAVDPTIIPLGANVNVENIGNRSADDTGGAILDYHIDIFVGFGQSAAQGWQNLNKVVRFLN